MVRLSSVMKQCDFVAYQPEIYIKNGEFTKYKTVCGGIMSILVFILTVLATVAFGMDIIYRENPSVVLNRNLFILLKSPSLRTFMASITLR